MKSSNRDIKDKLEPITLNKQEKDWKLSEMLEELRAVEEMLKKESSDPIFIEYRVFLFDKMREYMKKKCFELNLN